MTDCFKLTMNMFKREKVKKMAKKKKKKKKVQEEYGMSRGMVTFNHGLAVVEMAEGEHRLEVMDIKKMMDKKSN